MSNNAVSDKRIVIGLITGCVFAILIFHFAWLSKFAHNLYNPVFAVGYGILLGIFILQAYSTYRYKDDDRKDWKRKVTLLFAAFVLLWLGGWAVGSNEKKMFEDDVNKAKQTSQVYRVYINEAL
jgi:hypothetical protein